MSQRLSTTRLVGLSLAHHWRGTLALALGVAVGTAVLSGALFVGDSVRGSLRQLILDRFGRIDDVLVVDRFFRSALAGELAAKPRFQPQCAGAYPAIVLEATIESPASGRRANGVDLLAPQIDDFRQLGTGGPAKPPASDEIVLNRVLAEELGVNTGDELILRLPVASDIPRDSPLGRKTETIRNRRLTVTQIIPASGLGSFSLRPNQQTPSVAFVAPQTIQTALDQPHGVNAILVTGKSAAAIPSASADQVLQSLLDPQLSDYGLTIEKTPLGYFNLTSQRMVIDPPIERAVLAGYPTAQPALTYLANTIASGSREIPYSVVAAINPQAAPPLGPFITTSGQPLASIGEDEIVLNSWAAEDLGVEPGEKIKLAFFKPESTHGQVEETTVELRLSAVIKLEGAAADRDFTPTVKGITDEKSIADWNPPFPFDAARVRSADEEYWDKYRGTPKAFVSLAMGRRLWGSRFGNATSLRIVPPDASATPRSVAAPLKIDPASVNFVFRPVKRLGTAAASGTTPFNMLFLGFSIFIILAALLLIALLFRLSLDGRSREIGILSALGWPARQVRRLWLAEAALVAALGGGIGIALGLGYAWLMLVGLNTWWVDAVASPFVKLYVRPASIVGGYIGGVVISLLTIVWALRRLRHVAARRLLAEQLSETPPGLSRRARWPALVGGVLLLAAVATAILAGRLTGEAQAGAFMGSGAMVLVVLLLLLWRTLRGGDSLGPLATSRLAIPQLALRNGARNPLRSILTIGLVAAACFLIVAISAFRLAPPKNPGDRHNGTGGYLLVAETDQPIYGDIRETISTSAASAALQETKVFQIRVRSGDDASCLNLYQPRQPRVLGVPAPFIARGGFEWSGSLAQTPEEQQNPWLLLTRQYGNSAAGRAIMPIVVDAATAQYSLHLGDMMQPGGLGTFYELPSPAGNIPCLVVGLLKNSMLQGNLITSENAFLKSFPDATGYRFFVIDGRPDDARVLESTLETALGDYGFDAQLAVDRLAGYMVVQNTYLSTFQSLGALGLLLGTLGLAVVELRNVLERRAELAVLRAVGFRQRLLACLVLCENVLLLILGLAIGLAAALVAVAPHLATGDATVPWPTLFGMFGLIIAAALVTSLAAVRAMLRAPLIAALRGE